MAKARLYFDGDNTYIEKQARIYKMVDEIGEKIDNIPGVINDLNSTSETDALSAAMWKELQDQINALSWNFHFLSSWDCTTGLPWSDPATDPYVYQSWDYYIVSNTGSTNYKPHWSSYTHWVASTAVETQPVQMNDWYVYDGSTWILQPSGWQTIVIDTALSTTSTNPVENRVITQALNNKQDTISNLNTIISWAAAWATAVQPWDNITQLTNNAWYQTAGDVASAISWKQDVLTAGEGIDITNNVITNTWITCLTGWDDIQVIQWWNTHNLPAAYTELEYIYTAWWSNSWWYIDTGFTIWGSSTYKNTDIALEYIAQLENTGSYNVSWTAFASWIWVWVRGNLSMSYWVWSLVDNWTTMPVAKLKYYINWVTWETKVTNDTGIDLFTATATTSTKTGGVNIMIYTYPNAWTTPSLTRWKWFMYEFKILDWRTNEILWHWIPAMRNSDDVVWMYDIIWEQFFTSSGNAFTAWPETVDCTTVNFTNASWYMLKSSNKLIYATTDTAFNTRDKICTTADWNYSPTQWDVLALVFNHGCWVGSPRLNIDWSWLHDIRISTIWTNAANFWLGMDKISWLFVYDWTYWITWPIKDTLYSAWTWLSLSSWTFTNTQPWPTIWTTAPATPTEWAMWYDTTNHVLKVYNGTEWAGVGSWWGWGSTTWWNIWGILSNQTDLQDALDEKLESTDLIAWDGINIQAVWSELPSWYTQLAYIQLNWTQALNTWITWVWKTIEVDTQCTNSSSSTRQIVSTYWEDYLWMFFWAIWWSWAIQNNASWKIAWVTVSDRNILTWKFSLPNNQNKVELTVSWTTVAYTRTATARPDDNIHLWWAISTTNTLLYPYSWYIFSARIYDTATNVDVARYIPCQNISSIPWLYDTVSGTFFPATMWNFIAWPAVQSEWLEISVDDSVWTDDNVVAWTGIAIDTWTSARLPSWYTEVEWIQSDGNCALDSGVLITQMDKVEFVWNFVQNLWWFRCTVWVDDQNATQALWKYGVLFWEWTDWAWYTQAAVKASIDVFTYNSATPDTNEHTFQTYYSNWYLYIAVDNIVDSVQWDRPTWVQDTIWIFSRHVWASDTWSTVGSVFKMKSIKMYSWFNVVFEWVPCKRDSDDEIWLYDLTSGTFLENQKSWTFTAWPVVTFNPTKVISVDQSTLPTYTAWTGIAISNNQISSTVFDLTNLTYVSLASATRTPSWTSTVSCPAWAKLAFLSWRIANSSKTVVYWAWEITIPLQASLLKTAFIWWWTSSSSFVTWWVWYDSGSNNIMYTDGGSAWNLIIEYTIYFYK